MIDISLITEAVSGGSFDNYNSYVPAMEFVDDLDESTFLSARAAVLSEASNVFEYCHSVDEIMTEAVVVGNIENAAIISENAVSNVFQKIKKILNKIISVFKGLINKIKAFFYTLTGKTDKWVKLIRPRAQAASKRRGKGTIDAMMHDWKLDKVRDHITTVATVVSTVKTNTIDNMVTEIGEKINSSTDTSEMSSEDVDKFYCTNAGVEEDFNIKDFNSETIKTRLNEIWKEMSGGEKSNMSLSVTTMIDAVDGAKKLKSQYDSALSAAVNAYSAAEKRADTASKRFQNDEANDLKDPYATKPGETTDSDQYKSRIKSNKNKIAICEGYVRYIKVTGDISTSIIQMAIKAVKTMCSEYMGAVNRFVGVRDAAVNK